MSQLKLLFLLFLQAKQTQGAHCQATTNCAADLAAADLRGCHPPLSPGCMLQAHDWCNNQCTKACDQYADYLAGAYGIADCAACNDYLLQLIDYSIEAVCTDYLPALPSAKPSAMPSAAPSAMPSAGPSAAPSAMPSLSAAPSVMPSAARGGNDAAAETTGDPHTLGLHGDRFDNKGENNTVYCTFSSRDLHANVLFMYDTFLMGGTCANCMTKVVQGSFMKEIFLVANTAANTTLNIFFSAMRPSLAKYSTPHHRLLLDGELKVSAVLPSKDEFIADNVQVQLERVSARESHLTVKNDEYKIVAKSRMYPWADRNLKRKRLDLTISLVMDEKLIPVAPHGLIGQTFDKDDIAVDGKLDDYTGSKIDGHTSVVVTKAMGEGAIEGVLAEYEINRASPFSTAFKYSRFGLTMADPRNISALSGTKRKIIKVKGIPGSASAVHDITDAMAETSPAA